MRSINKPVILEYDGFPKITSNGTMGGNVFACDSENSSNYATAYKIFNYESPDYVPQSISQIGYWVSWYHPNPVNITQLKFYVLQVENWLKGKIQVCNDNNTWADLASYSINNVNEEINLSYSGYYHYYRMTFDEGYKSTTAIGFKNISSDDNVRTPVGTCLIPNTTSILQPTRKYYKYSISSWTQPVLITDGLLGGYCMAVNSSREPYSTNYAYRAFDNNSSTRWYPAGTGSAGIPIILTIYIPENINISNFQFTNAANGNNAPNAFTISASSDNVNYTSLGSFTNTVQSANATWDVDLSSNTGYYQYYKIEFTQWNGAATGGRGVKEIAITATQKTVIEGTSSDYDFYEDIETYQAIV